MGGRWTRCLPIRCLTFVVTETPKTSLSAKREALARIHVRYQRADRPHKQRIMDEFATCGYHRKAALRLLNHPLCGRSSGTSTLATPNWCR